MRTDATGPGPHRRLRRVVPDVTGVTGDTGRANHFPEQIGASAEMYDGDVPARPSNVKERATRVRFRRAVSLMVMTLLVPGSAQLLAGNRKVGRIALRVWFGAVLTLVGTLLVGLVWHGAVFYLVSNTLVLGVLRVAADGRRDRLGAALHGRLAARSAAVAPAEPPARRRRAQRLPQPHDGCRAALRCAPGRRPARLHRHDVRQRRGHRRPRRALQRAACSAATPAPAAAACAPTR